MSEMLLRQPGFTDSTYRTFVKTKERIKIFKGKGDFDIFIKMN